MDSNYFRTYYIRNGQWAEGLHNWATGIGYLMYTRAYHEEFDEPIPFWLCHFELFDRVRLLKNAVETKKPLPRYNSVVYLPIEFPTKMNHDQKVRFIRSLSFWYYSNDN